MINNRLPAGLNTALENDILQKGAGGLWYARGADEFVVPNVLHAVDSNIVLAREGCVVTVEVNTASANWSAAVDSLTLPANAQAGDVIRVIDVGGDTSTDKDVVIKPGSGTIEGAADYTLGTPYAMAVFYRKSDGSWAVLAQGQNGRTIRSVSVAPFDMGLVSVANLNHTLRVITTSWPLTGGKILLPTTNKRGLRVTITTIDANDNRKRIQIDPGSGTINGSQGDVMFSNAYGSITLECVTASTWTVVASTASLIVNADDQGAVASLHADTVPVIYLVRSGWPDNGILSLQTLGAVGARVLIVDADGICPGVQVRAIGAGGAKINGSAAAVSIPTAYGALPLLKVGPSDWVVVH